MRPCSQANPNLHTYNQMPSKLFLWTSDNFLAIWAKVTNSENKIKVLVAVTYIGHFRNEYQQ